MPDNKDLKQAIQNALSAFEKQTLEDAALGLLNTMGYGSERRLGIKPNSADQFRAEFDAERRLNEEAALTAEWLSVDVLFQITDAEVRQALHQSQDMFAAKKVDDKDIRSYLFFAVELKSEKYTRAQLAGITREINKLFPMPVMVVFRYNHVVSLGIITRRINKRDGNRDVLEKVTLIKDIRFTGNRAQIEILHDLAITQLMQDYSISNFVDLQHAWEKTLDLNELNKKFYKEIANWYFWAVKTVKFPKDAEKDEATRNATGVIRLITRLIFVWFIKEKGLVPEALFDERWLKDTLKFDDPNAKRSTYYKAILQNLFFATLNTEMGAERMFRRENAKGQDPDYLMSNFYRYKRYFKNQEKALEIFAGIPFLNGGLFECLDKEIEKGVVVRVDGFSDRDDNPLTVPDDLFLMEKEKEIDLNEVYDTKNKKYKVRGLIHIFNSYKFTIEENTPIEEEIALDPELLGKVFENLLAAYNPETGTTARKQTGSFYTPREIVNYMVDEALLAYLNAEVRSQNAEFEERLRDLLSYNPNVPDFSEEEKSRLIAAIDNVKVLDPAAGSGAFPMGVLHKLVFLLAKLDPKNEGWQRKQILKANEIQDAVAREAAVRSIEEVFAENHDDYGRKLYLIENCIYGVDIQPIAVQIAKLRFFISLVVDQKTNAKKPNLGIRPLPNLETKFVAANTLIGIQRPDSKLENEARVASIPPEVEEACEGLIRKLEQYLKSRNPDLRARYVQEAQEFADVINAGMGADFQPLAVDWVFSTAKDTAALKSLLPVKREAKASPMTLRNQQIEEKEKELERVRREHFSARTPATKRKYRDLDKKLRLEIADLLSKNHALEDEAAQQLAGWDPYNQNAHADFFDPEWMFGIEGGFDVVIGNPPYGADFSKDFRKWAKLYYKSASGEIDSYILFVEKSMYSLKNQGTLAFILPDTWLTLINAEHFRKWILKNYHIKELVMLNGLVFHEAVVDTMLIFIRNTMSTEILKTQIRSANKAEKINDVSELPVIGIKQQKTWETENQSQIKVFSVPEIEKLLEKIKRDGSRLDQFIDYRAGCKPYEEGKGNPPQTKKVLEEKPYTSSTKKGKDWLPLLRGNDIKRYDVSIKRPEYILYGARLAAPRSMDVFSGERILVQAIRNPGIFDRIIAAYSDETFITRINVYSLLAKTKDVDLFFLLAIINSKLMNWYLKKDYGLHTYIITGLLALPIKSPPNTDKKAIIKLVTKILAAKRGDPQADTSKEEGEIDQLVYQLYGLSEDEVKIVEGKS